MALINLLEGGQNLVNEIQRRGPRATASVESAKETLTQYCGNLDEEQIASALLFMIIAPEWHLYSPSFFVSAVQESLESCNWQRVVQEFDCDDYSVSKEQFLALLNALLPVAHNDSQFDIQALWGGRWHHSATQLHFAMAFASLSSTTLDARTIPGLRKSYDPMEYIDGPQEVLQYIEEAQRDTMISVDAVAAIINLAFTIPERPEDAEAAKELILGPKQYLFLCAAAGVPKPWSPVHLSVMGRLVTPYLEKEFPEYSYVLYSLWRQDKQWLASTLAHIHSEEPLKMPLILDHAHELRWLPELSELISGFGVDLVALAHRHGYIDLEQWAQSMLTRSPNELAATIVKFLKLKAEDEMRAARGEQPGPRTVNLTIKTVSILLDALEQATRDAAEIVSLERQCIQAYPRLINYGEGVDDVIDQNGADSNQMSGATDVQMQDLYKRMYNSTLEVRDIISLLQEYKTSREPAKQDLFACMIHGLFDEFVCFSEYPLQPLAMTAVLFGGIINYGLITGLTLRVGLGMILEAVRDNVTQTSMYKFGLQALLHMLDRLPEWRGYCSLLVQIPGLQGTEAFVKAAEVLGQGQSDIQSSFDAEPNGINGVPEGMGLSNGEIDDFLAPNIHFKSIHAESATNTEMYEDPDSETQEKVVFFFNNVSDQNLPTKLKDVQNAISEKHHQWFASMLVEERAKLEPNLQQLYLDMLKLLGNKQLWAEVLRETYISVQRMLNAESTMNSQVERKYLKSLANWLGSLTIARDKPIKHRNISFKDLLIEGYETDRLLIVIPFTCNVLIQASKSTVFKPPNPWTVEILRVLMELYKHVELKLNQKFEIEVLCKELGVDRNSLEPSTDIRAKPPQEEDLAAPMMPDGIESFDELGLGGINRPRNARFSPQAIAASIPDLESMLVFPPSTGSIANQHRLRQIVQNAVQRAILEIIAPVVERSVTIATIATTNLIHKDFARESDEDRVRKSAQQMVRQLSGSLALVTCKEPLRMSMTNYIRMAQAEFPDQAFPEGAILMCVNDNLDTACGIVEKQAEDRSMPEIEAHIDAEIAQRRQHRLEHPNEPYTDPGYNRWAGFIPEPYKQGPGGLNQEQMAIYLDFARQSRGSASHAQNASADSGRQLPDVLQEAFSVPNNSTSAEPPATPRQLSRPQQGRMLPPPVPTAIQQHSNGFMDARAISERIEDLVAEITHLAKDRPERTLKVVELDQKGPMIDITNQIVQLIRTSQFNQDALAWQAANTVCMALYGQTTNSLQVEVLVHLLDKLCQYSPSTSKEVAMSFANQEDEKILNVPVTIALLEAGFMDLRQVDMTLTKAIRDRRLVSIGFLSDIMNALLLNSHPIALRADFASSLGAMGQWLIEEPGLTMGKELMQRLRDWGVHEHIESRPDERSLIRQHQLQYIFAEWVTMCGLPNSTDKMFGAFISQLHQKQLLNSQEEMALFLRLCIDNSVEAYEREDPNSIANEGYFNVDCLAKLIVLLVKNQGETDGAVRGSKAAYMNSILSLVALIFNNHHVMRGELFNQRVFFRLYSSILCDWHDYAREDYNQDRDMILVFADNFLILEPRYFPSYTYSWLILISHRMFMPTLLKLRDNEVSKPIAELDRANVVQGWDVYAKIMDAALSYVGELLMPTIVSPLAKDLYRGVLRILLILHHDFPEFLAENHYRLCNIIPTHCMQLRNLVLSAYPSSFPELPDPFTAGLKVDRLDEIRTPPRIAGDIVQPLLRIKDLIDNSLRSVDISDESMTTVANAAYNSSSDFGTSNVDSPLLHALVLYIGQSALSAAGQKGGPSFSNDSPQATFMTKLAKELHPEARYHFLSAIANQLRYPNSHTHYFSYALLHLFGNDLADQQESDVRQQITRVLLERLIVHRPHPWGLIITLLELLKNPSYMFWDLPFIKAAPEVCNIFRRFIIVSNNFINANIIDIDYELMS